MNPTSRTAVSLFAAGLGVAGISGCGNGLTGSATGRATTRVVTTSSPSASPTPSPGATTTPTPSSSRAVPATCPVDALRVGTDDGGGGAAGSLYVLLTFTNTSRTTCVLSGHPGVSFVGKHDGTQIGQPAVRRGRLRVVGLAPGERTTSVLQIANAADYDATTCAPTTTDGFRVYPPGSTSSVFVRFRTQACQGDLTSTGSPQLSVTAVGAQG